MPRKLSAGRKKGSGRSHSQKPIAAYRGWSGEPPLFSRWDENSLSLDSVFGNRKKERAEAIKVQGLLEEENEVAWPDDRRTCVRKRLKIQR